MSAQQISTMCEHKRKSREYVDLGCSLFPWDFGKSLLSSPINAYGASEFNLICPVRGIYPSCTDCTSRRTTALLCRDHLIQTFIRQIPQLITHAKLS